MNQPNSRRPNESLEGSSQTEPETTTPARTVEPAGSQFLLCSQAATAREPASRPRGREGRQKLAVAQSISAPHSSSSSASSGSLSSSAVAPSSSSSSLTSQSSSASSSSSTATNNNNPKTTTTTTTTTGRSSLATLSSLEQQPGSSSKQTTSLSPNASSIQQADKTIANRRQTTDQVAKSGKASLEPSSATATGQQQQQHQQRPSVVLLGSELLQLAQKGSQAAAPSAAILKRSIVGKSSTLLHSLRRHYNSYTATTTTTNSNQPAASQQQKHEEPEGQLRGESSAQNRAPGECSSGADNCIAPPSTGNNNNNSNNTQLNLRVAATTTTGEQRPPRLAHASLGAGKALIGSSTNLETNNLDSSQSFYSLGSTRSLQSSSFERTPPQSPRSDNSARTNQKQQDDATAAQHLIAGTTEEEFRKDLDRDQRDSDIQEMQQQQQSVNSGGAGKSISACSSNKPESQSTRIQPTAAGKQKPPVPPPPQQQQQQSAAAVLTPTKWQQNRQDTSNLQLTQQIEQLQTRSSGNLTQLTQTTSSLINNNRLQSSGKENNMESIFPPPTRSLGDSSVSFKTSPVASARRHALLAQSFERDAILSLKVRELKHKRGSSIKSALKNAHLGPLKLSFDRRNRHQQNNDSTTTSNQGECSSGGGVFGVSKKSQRHQHQHQKPYELFEPPITQRSVQRNKRRGAMMASDPRRQMSADTIGLRQLTDEYLANAGVLKPMSSSGQCSLVALQAPTATGQPPSAAASAASPAGAGSVGFYGTQPQYSLLEAQLYQATRSQAAKDNSGSQANSSSSTSANHQNQNHHEASSKTGTNNATHHQPHRGGGGPFKTAISMIETHSTATRTRSNSDDSMGVGQAATNSSTSATGSASSIQQQARYYPTTSNDNNICTSLAGSLPWQTDVSIQCELLPAPPLVEPYETTGDILSAIARPYPGSNLAAKSLGNRARLREVQAESLDTTSHQHQHHHHHHHNLSATLRKGLTAISQHHLAPGGLSAQEVASNVVGSLKKSLSNTLDVTNRTSHTPSCLYSQDSLPAYSSLQNEPEDGAATKPDNHHHHNTKLSRQSSTKLMVNTAVAAVGKKCGLQRALSFDCRGGYQKHRQASSSQHQDSADSASSAATTSISSNNNKLTCNNNNNLSIGQQQQQSQHTKSTQSITISNNNQADANNYLPRPYLPQSASQVDFQVPLLPYERMKEAIVSNRLLGGPAQQSNASLIGEPQMLTNQCSDQHPNTQSQGSKHRQQQQHSGGKQVDVDELICVQNPRGLNGGEIQFEHACAQGPSAAANLDQADNGARAKLMLSEDVERRAPKLVVGAGKQPSPSQDQQAHAEESNKIGAVQFIAQAPPDSDNQQQTSRLLAASNDDDDNEQQALSSNTRATRQFNQVTNISGSGFRRGQDVHEEDGEEQVASPCAVTFNLLQAPGGAAIPNSPSFSISADGKTSSLTSSGQLTASEIFSGSNQLIKRPSTLLAADAMTQFAQALSSSGSGGAANQQQQQQVQSTSNNNNSSARNRRQAIVPPKLSTDPDCDSDERSYDESNYRRSDEARVTLNVGRLVDIASPGGKNNNCDNNYAAGVQLQRRASADELSYANARRKRSGGDPIGHREKQQATTVILPSFTIDDHDDQTRRGSNEAGASQQQDLSTAYGNQHQRPSSVQGPATRPDSQMTNPESFASSSASSLCKRELNHQPGGQLSVNFDTFRDRRRSSIAIIPQMQICPGDLLVYSKQLIERMNQTEEISETPEFLTVDKKGKNIWSSFKLFDNRSIKARHEYLCNLDEVLNTLQPSTFIDEQLSHYKGMVWNEFLVETESRRSASSEALAAIHLLDDDCDDDGPKLVDLRLSDDDASTSANELGTRGRGLSSDAEIDSRSEATPQHQAKDSQNKATTLSSTANRSTSGEPGAGSRSGSMKMLGGWSIRGTRGSVKGSSSAKVQEQQQQLQTNSNNQQPQVTINKPPISSATTSPLRNNPAPPAQQQTNNGGSPLRPLGRFKEKPKLRRGQTVDSVFRIPLVPSSPLKHALHHQQTPTAHLENQHNLITTIEDDYESGSGSGSGSSRQIASAAAQADKPNDHGKPATSNEKEADQEAVKQHRSSVRRKAVGCETADSGPSAPPAGGHRSSFRSSMQANNSSNDQFETSFDLDSSETLDINSGRSSSGFQQQQQAKKSSTQLAQLQQHQREQRNRQFMRQSSLSTLSSTVTRTEQKRQRALWDLFQSECTFFFDHLMTLKNVYMEPLKKIQVEGFAMQADPDVLFGNLDELCCGVYDFCKEFLQIIIRTLKHQPEELNATDVLIKLYKHNPKIEHLRGIYHRYTLNYINALTYLDTLRRQVEFVEFEKWSSRDARCKKLQLTDLLVAPVQHIMRVPIILKDIESHTEDLEDKREIRAILAVEEASLRELDDKMRWLKNFERLLEIQKNIIWPSVVDLEPKVFVPEFLRDVLSKQPCEKLIVSPRRQIVHEGTLSNFDSAKACDMHVILFDDMLLFTRRKKGLTKRTSNVCRGTPSNTTTKDDGSFKYIVYKHPLSLDRIYVHDVPPADSQAMGIKNVILIVVLNRFQQITTLHWFSAPNEDIKQTWQYKMKKTMDRWKKLGNDADGRRSETMEGHEMTLQEQIQQSMDAEASQVPVELLHNWIDRRNRSTRPQLTPSSVNNEHSRNNQQRQMHQHLQSVANSSYRPAANQQQSTNKHSDERTGWRLSSDLEYRTGGAATTTTILTNSTSKSQSQTLPTQDNHPNTQYANDNQSLVNFRSNPNSPERHQQPGHQQRGDFSLNQQQPQQYQARSNSETLQFNSGSTIVGHTIELKVTDASVNSEEIIDNEPKEVNLINMSSNNNNTPITN